LGKSLSNLGNRMTMRRNQQGRPNQQGRQGQQGRPNQQGRQGQQRASQQRASQQRASQQPDPRRQSRQPNQQRLSQQVPPSAPPLDASPHNDVPVSLSPLLFALFFLSSRNRNQNKSIYPKSSSMFAALFVEKCSLQSPLSTSILTVIIKKLRQ